MISEPVPFVAPDGASREAIVTQPEGRACGSVVLHGLSTPRRRAADPASSRLAHDLVDLGFQVVRYVPRILVTADPDVDWEMEVADAVGAVSLARGLTRAGGVHVFGLSLGGVAAPIAAGRAGGVSTIATWGSTARPWPEYVTDNVRVQLGLRGFEPERIERHATSVGRWYELVVETDLAGGDLLAHVPDASRYCIDGHGYQGRSVRFWRQLARLDPPASYRGLDCPVLAVRGGADCASHPADHRAILDAARAAGLEAEGLVIDGVDHGFRPCPDPRSSLMGLCAGEPDSTTLAEAFSRWALEACGA
jgi:pimeloyl-ACP methyl ester carboxylesterase